MSMTDQPREGKCGQCGQQRALFPYKPEHDCTQDHGSVRLDEAWDILNSMEENGDRWCLRRIERRAPINLCTSCYGKEAEAEEKFIKEELND